MALKLLLLLRHRCRAEYVFIPQLSALDWPQYNWRISSSPRNSPIFLLHPLVDLLTTYYGDYYYNTNKLRSTNYVHNIKPLSTQRCTVLVRAGEQNGYNIPELSAAPEVEDLLSEAGGRRLRQDPALVLPPRAKRLVSGTHTHTLQLVP